MNSILKEDYIYILEDKNIDWSVFAGSSVLVSGASGFLPSYMVQTLLYLNKLKKQEPVKLIALVRNIEKAKVKYKDYLDDKNLVFIEQDVSEPFVIEEKVDYIIHAASQASPKYFFSDPVGTINANSLGTSNLLSIAKDKKVKAFLYFSTGEVCGDIFERKDIVNECDYGSLNPLEIRNCYAESKRIGENMCACWHYQYGVPAKIIRPSHTYGPGFSLDDGRAFTNFVSSVLNNQNIVLNSDGSAKRSFCYLADATRAYFNVLLNGTLGEAYNVSNSYEISIYDLAALILDLSPNKDLKIEFADGVNAKSSVSSKCSHGLLGIEKIKKLGWEPKIKEKEGFCRTITSYKEIYNE